MKLYSYCIPYDDGAAPNPYWGVCTLVICKPMIRRTAEVGDWIVGHGSVNSPIGNISSSIVYAMKVTAVMTMAEYDGHCRDRLPRKIPEWKHADFRRKVGDCIYDFSGKGPPRLRPSVHTAGNRRKDLGGKNALLSEHFYYFGDKPVPLPQGLRPILHPSEGHKSHANDPYVETFVSWIENSGYRRNAVHGEPQLKSAVIAKSEVGYGETPLCDTGEARGPC